MIGKTASSNAAANNDYSGLVLQVRSPSATIMNPR
jgi:hypothetical protein